MLLKSRAYVIKRLDEVDGAMGSGDTPGKLGQVTWSKYGGPSKAWAVAVARAGFQT